MPHPTFEDTLAERLAARAANRENRAYADAHWAKERQAEAAEAEETKAAAEFADENPVAAASQYTLAKMAAADAEKAYQETPMAPGVSAAYLAAMGAVRDAADVAHRVAQYQLNQELSLAERRAGDSPSAAARTKAEVHSQFADRMAGAEKALADAKLAFDRAAVDVARACKNQAARIEAAKVRITEREKAEQDVLRLSNPFADPVRPVITQSQFDAIRDPALQLRAAREATIIDDPHVTFTVDDARSVLRCNGSGDRAVISRSEFSAVTDPASKMKLALSAVIIDD